MDLNLYKPSVISQKGAGLCNILFNIINGIIQHSDKIIVLDEINSDYSKHNRIAVSDILDLEKTTFYLKELFPQVSLLDRTECHLKVISCKYGIQGGKGGKDVTHLFKNENILLLKSWNLNSIFGDPYPGKKKNLKLRYQIDANKYTDFYEEDLKNDIIWNRQMIRENIWLPEKYNFSWYNAHNEDLFKKIVLKLRFNKKFYDIANTIYEEIKVDKMHVIHLRIEDDAITHWSKQNRLSETEFKTVLEGKYEKIIKENILTGESILVLSHIKSAHLFIKKLKNDYNIILIDKEKYINTADRELNAVVDLILSTYCSGIFIGNHNFRNKRGSSFSYIINCLISCPKIFIDLDNIKADVETFNF